MGSRAFHHRLQRLSRKQNGHIGSSETKTSDNLHLSKIIAGYFTNPPKPV